MQHRDYVFKWLFYSLTVLAFVLLQVFVLVHVRLWGIHPFVFPALVATIAALESPHDSAVFVLAFGLVLDITMPGRSPAFTPWRLSWCLSYPDCCRPRCW